jgi:hypothetical protein
MHKKVIEGRSYYYTSYRDNQGKVKTKYLGADEKSALAEEKKFQSPGFNKNYIILASLLVFAFIGLALFKSFTGGFFFAESGSVVEFDLNETWNLSNGFVRVSQNMTVVDVGLVGLVVDNKVVVDLDDYNLSQGDVYVDLVYDSVVIDSAHVSYARVVEEVVNETEPLVNLTVEEVVEVQETEEQDTSVDFDSYEEVEGKFNAAITLDTGTYDGSVDFYELDSLSSVESVEVFDPVGEGIQTAIIFASASNFTNATLYAQMIGFVEKIVRCDDWNGVACLSDWEDYTTDFNENDTYIWFNVSSFSAYAGWYNPTVNNSDTLQVDYVVIDKDRPSQNETLTCQNGSVSGDVTELLYSWYVNDSFVAYQNLSTLGPGNFSKGDKVECGIVAQNGTNLAAYFGINEAGGSHLYDLVHNNSLVIRGDPVWGNFSGHKALTFDGIDDYAVNMSPVKNLDAVTNFTIEAWVKPAAIAQTGGIVSKEDDWALRYKTGRVSFMLSTVAGYNEIAVSGASTSLDWQHYVAVYNSSNVLLYRDGAIVKQASISVDVNITDNELNIGLLNETKQFFNGSIGEVVIYNRTITDSEILDHYQNGVIKYSDDYLEVETNSEHFGNGTVSQTNITWQSGNITLANETASAFYSYGNFTSQIIEILNDPIGNLLSWSEDKSAGENVSLQVRSGEIGYNGSVIWSDFSGPDYTHIENDYRVLALDFGENSGNTTRDYGFGAVDVDLNPSVSRVHDGMHGSAVHFDGTQGLVLANDYNFLRFDDIPNFSMQVWIKPETTSSNCILNKDGAYLMILINDKIRFIPVIGGGATLVTSSSTIPTDEWTHVGVTYDNTTLILYINGVVEDTQAINGLVNTTTKNLWIGRQSSDEDNYFNGTIDSLALYNTTLSTAAMKESADNKFVNNSGGKLGRLNRFVEYKVLLETNNTNSTPVVTDVVLSYMNYSNYIYNSVPSNISLVDPSNGTNLSAVTDFNWTNSTDSEDNSTIYYEYVIGNDINLYNVTVSGLAINNYSECSYEDDNYTIFVEHFHSLKHIRDNGWTVFDASFIEGKFGDGIRFSEAGDYIERSVPSDFNEGGSVEFWIKPEWNGSDDGAHALFWTSNSFPRVLTSNEILFLFVGSDDQVSYNISSWNASTWHHVVANWQSGLNYSLIIDGVKVNESNISSIEENTGDLFYLGASRTGTQPSNATFDELRISNVPRNQISDLQNFNVTIYPNLYGDDVYYWKVRPFDYTPIAYDGERIHSNWSDVRTITLDTNVPYFNSYIQEFLYVLTNTKSLNLTTNEDTNCFYRNDSLPWTLMNNTGGLSHGETLDWNAYGAFTYFVKCNDSFAKEVNDTVTFAVMETIPSNSNETFKYDFYAGNRSNFTFIYNSNTLINISLEVANNLTAYVNVMRFGSNPEENGDNLPGIECSSYVQIVMDSHLVGNLTYSNISVYYGTPIAGNTSNIAGYQFNLSSLEWGLIPNAERSTSTFNFNSSYTRTFVIATDERTDGQSSTSTGEGIAEDEEWEEEEWYECDFDSECGEGYVCEDGWCEWAYEEEWEEEWAEDEWFEGDESVVGLESDDEEQGSVMQVAEGVLGETGATIFVTGAYIGGGTFIGYYLMLGLLSLVFFFRKKYDVGDVEIKDSKSKLENYIYSQLDQGISKEKVISSLVSKGWDENKVKEIIRKV